MASCPLERIRLAATSSLWPIVQVRHYAACGAASHARILFCSYAQNDIWRYNCLHSFVCGCVQRRLANLPPTSNTFVPGYIGILAPFCYSSTY
jgi:hypothetical protein